MRSAPTRRPPPKPASTCPRSCSRSTASAASPPGIGGLVSASQVAAASSTFGFQKEFPVIAAAVLGGTSLFGGRGGVVGTVFGAVLIQTVENGLVMTNADPVRLSADHQRHHLHRGPGRFGAHRHSRPARATQDPRGGDMTGRLRGTRDRLRLLRRESPQRLGLDPRGGAGRRLRSRPRQGRQCRQAVRRRAALYRRRDDAARAEAGLRRHRDHRGLASGTRRACRRRAHPGHRAKAVRPDHGRLRGDGRGLCGGRRAVDGAREFPLPAAAARPARADGRGPDRHAAFRPDQLPHRRTTSTSSSPTSRPRSASSSPTSASMSSTSRASTSARSPRSPAGPSG